MVTLAQAQAAGPLATEIIQRNNQVTAINAAVSGHWVITSCRARDPATGDVIELVLEPLDDATSQQSLQFILSIYQAQLSALNSQLAAV